MKQQLLFVASLILISATTTACGNEAESLVAVAGEDSEPTVVDGYPTMCKWGETPDEGYSCFLTRLDGKTFRALAEQLAKKFDVTADEVVRINGWEPYLDVELIPNEPVQYAIPGFEDPN